LGAKLRLALATVESDAETIISDLAMQAQNLLLKEFGNDKEIPRDNLRVILAGAIFVQNSFIGVGTNLTSSLVAITAEKLRSVQQYYC
jgi:hypothetical protein